MARRCIVCYHPERGPIELGLACKVGMRQLCKKYGIPEYSLYRHREKHMSPQFVASLRTNVELKEIDLAMLRKSQSEGILQHLVSLRGRLYELLALAEESGDIRGATAVHSRLLANIETTAKIVGELTNSTLHLHQNLVVSPEYVQLRHALVSALRRYPEASSAVVKVLKEIETNNPVNPELLEPPDELIDLKRKRKDEYA